MRHRIEYRLNHRTQWARSCIQGIKELWCEPILAQQQDIIRKVRFIIKEFIRLFRHHAEHREKGQEKDARCRMFWNTLGHSGAESRTRCNDWSIFHWLLGSMHSLFFEQLETAC